MEKQKKIIDASVGLKWFFKEEGSDKAEELLNLHIENNLLLVVPELFFYEVANALRFKHKKEEDLNSAIIDLEFMQLHTPNYSFDIIKKAIEIALKYKLTIYDATYISLAEKLNAKLITADREIINSKHPLVENII